MAAQPDSSLTQIQSRPLNVKDALSYLDDVKTQFNKQPDVYNKFLDIMKDFKTQAIDTPGVIERVSQLFRSHPLLIQGFNTFLPPGYRIDALIENGVVHTINIVNPTGGVTTRNLTPDSTPGPSASTSFTPAPAPSHTNPQPSETSASAEPSTAHPPSAEPRRSASAQPVPSSAPPQSSAAASAPPPQTSTSSNMHLAHMPPPSVSSAPSMVATPGAAGILTEQNPQRPPVEFNHAINYVNKIKTRFANDQSTYKHFLEILQNYQKDNKPIKEVYAQVRQLFASSPDLLEEFSQFLPDHTGEANSILGPGPAGAAAANSIVGAQPPRKKAKNTDPDYRAGPSGRMKGAGARSQQMPVASHTPMSEDKRRRKTNDASATGASIAASSLSQPLGPSAAAMAGGSANKRARKGALSPPLMGMGPMGQITYEASVPGVGPPIGAYGVPSKPVRPHQPLLASEPLVTPDEIAFFERVKRHIDDKTVHQEFLKLLNLFTQKLIDLPTLMNKAYLFLGSNVELFNEFKMLVNWDITEHGLIEDEPWPIENERALQRPRLDYNHLPGYGFSYKRLPLSEVELACSGRDAHCWSVLNDHWVAHATWASEGSGIHRPNANEEALMSSEQERHWYAVTLTTNHRAIAILEPINTRISMMDDVQKAEFKLAEGFNDTNPSILERAVKKIYCTDGAGIASNSRLDAASEALQAIYDSPAVAVPVILKRLKTKDEDFQRAIREWNKVWREVDAKNWYRALDHQSAQFKTNDKKTMSSRTLITAIEELRKEHKQQRVAADPANVPFIPPERSNHQFELRMSDKSVLFDVMRLTFSYLGRVQSAYSLPERERVEGSIRIIVQLMLGISKSEMEEALGVYEFRHADDDEDSDSDDNTGAPSETGASTGEDQSGPASSTGEVRRRGVKASAADLRRRLLASTVNNTPGEGSNPLANGFHSKAASPEPADRPGNEGLELGSESTWVSASSEPVEEQSGRRQPSPSKESPSRPSGSSSTMRRYNFFANDSFYCLLRVFHILYHRLQTLKLAAQEMAASNAPSRLNPIAVELGISNPLPIIDISADDSKHPAEGYYAYLLDLCEKFFENEIDASTYEENLRMMWGTKSFYLFTVDKQIQGLIKHVHAINNDEKSQELLQLLETDRRRESTTLRQQIAYRMEAETVIDSAEERLYRFEWIPSHQALTMQLLGPSDMTLDTTASPRTDFDYYVSSYVLSAPTEGIGAKVSAPLLKRNHRASPKAEQNFKAESDAELRFGAKSFKMYHVRQTGDTMVRQRSTAEESLKERDDRIRAENKEAFDGWLQKRVEGAADTSVAGADSNAMQLD